MENLEEQIEKAKGDFNYYLNKRQKYLDNQKKFEYYNERVIIKEEKLINLLLKQNANEKKSKKKRNKNEQDRNN